VNFSNPGIPFQESFFAFAIAGPFAGPAPATLDDFRAIVDTPTGPQSQGGNNPARSDQSL